VIDQFNEAQLPKPFWGLGRQIALTVQSKRIRDLHEMGDPNPLAAWLIKRTIFAKVWIAENILPDSKMSAPERARAEGDTTNQHGEPCLIAASARPFHTLRGKPRPGASFEASTATYSWTLPSRDPAKRSMWNGAIGKFVAPVATSSAIRPPTPGPS
jgi:hypothetical protein